MAQDLFTYAARCERAFENFAAETGYERKTTFVSDLSIAECYGLNEVRDTYQRVMKAWIKDLEYIVEFVMALNFKCWEHNERHNDNLSALYSDLYHEAINRVYDHYENNKEAQSYIFHTLD